LATRTVGTETRVAEGRPELFGEPNALAGDSTHHGGTARRRYGSQTRRQISARRTDECSPRQSLRYRRRAPAPNRRKARMAQRLQRKLALITAAGQGIGRAIAEA